MKNKRKQFEIISFLFLTFIFASPLYAQNAERQVLIPLSVLVGDTATLNISFSSREKFDSVSVQNFSRPINEKEYFIKQLALRNNGKDKNGQNQYVLSIIFIPWVTGSIKFPPVTLKDGFTVTPSEISINSVFSVTQSSKKFSDAKGPLLLPGTTYRLLFKIIFYIILLLIGFVLLLKWKQLSIIYKNLKLKILYIQNKKKTIKFLANLNDDKNTSDKEKAFLIQNCMRSYLNTRFSYPFTNCATSEIAPGFQRIFQGLLSDKKEDAVFDLTGIFTRTDYIRYAKDASFAENELKDIIRKLSEIIETFEKPEEASEK